MSKVIKFPNDSEGEDENVITITKQFCQSCGGGLDMWVGTDGVAYGICPKCDLVVGQLPITINADA